MTFISGLNKSALYLQEHVMCEHYASDYKSVGPMHYASDYYESLGLSWPRLTSRAITIQLFNRRQSSLMVQH